MKTTTFKDWDLDTLDAAFALKQIWDCPLLTQWQNNNQAIDEFETHQLLQLQKSLIRGG